MRRRQVQRVAALAVVAAAPDGVDAGVPGGGGRRPRGGLGGFCIVVVLVSLRSILRRRTRRRRVVGWCAFGWWVEGLEARRGVQEGDGPVDVVGGVVVAPEPVVGAAVCHDGCVGSC